LAGRFPLMRIAKLHSNKHVRPFRRRRPPLDLRSQEPGATHPPNFLILERRARGKWFQRGRREFALMERDDRRRRIDTASAPAEGEKSDEAIAALYGVLFRLRRGTAAIKDGVKARMPLSCMLLDPRRKRFRSTCATVMNQTIGMIGAGTKQSEARSRETCSGATDMPS